MYKKDLSLLVLILVVGTVVAIINPRFLSPINIANTANLIGLFGVFSIGMAFGIITVGMSCRGSIFALPRRPSHRPAWTMNGLPLASSSPYGGTAMGLAARSWSPRPKRSPSS